MALSDFKITFFIVVFKKNSGAFISGPFLIVMEFFVHLSSMVSSKIDSFEYKAVKRWVDVQELPVQVFAVSSQIKGMSVEVVTRNKHLTWSQVCWDIYGQKGEKLLGRMNHSRPGKR